MSNPQTTASAQTHFVSGSFSVTGWDETKIYAVDDETVTISGAEYPARGFNRADVTYAYTGDIAGTGQLTYLLGYVKGSDSPTVGFQAFTGSIDGHEGSLVLQHNGFHNEDGVHERLDIVAGLGTGGLSTMTGYAEVDIVGHHESYEITLRYSMS
ncbi:hypothetical protein GOEFS_015_00060 [Gordonia effusa NBRC 100432]|uniref:DUF3224 domain-containing protein n=1 Tax=Gordonia effusa NBRC 100432 TaxID=1077974 RepID=H0QVK3_9ACTN|nr:DUF3224 domain-containing protein [Gordonia effusa]GAB16809.1 hypothetical protein GOEFS_015_00060 [Gordonia effusa NBRC 100432]